MPETMIAVDDPRADDVRALLARHLEFARAHTPPEDVHALDVDGLVDPAVTFFSGSIH
jgi:putative acetyltransferase